MSAHRARNIKRRYGITVEQYDEMLAAQGGACKLCGVTSPGGRGGWCVDHCHGGSQVRGLLCHHCNIGLGMFKDDPALLVRAAQYIAENDRKEEHGDSEDTAE